jgi:hypothetical protein
MPTRVYYGKAVSGSDYVNNGATVVGGGNIGTNAPVTNVPTTAQVLGHRSGSNGSSVASGDYAGAKWITYGADFATMTAGQYVIRRNCSQLAGNSYTGLQSGGNAAGAHHSIHFNTSRSTVMIEYWLYPSGVPVYAATNPSGCEFGDDHAALPTRAIPGELVYMVTGTTATSGDYPARTQW